MPGARGFTLLELMVVLALLAIVLLEGLPAMSQYLQNRTLREVAEEITDGLREARMQAIRRDGTVQFSLAGTGWTVVAPGATSASNVTLATRPSMTRESAIAVTGGPVSFDGTGQTPNLTGGTFAVTTNRGACKAANGPYTCLDVTVSPMGAIRMCNPALGSSNPQGC